MRTSGNDSDTLLFLAPVAILAVLAVLFLGGPSRTIDIIDETVIDALHWVRTRL